MASQFESGDQWTVQRLRSPDANYYAGAVGGARSLPPPIALASGPGAQTNAGIVGGNEYWVLDTALPAVDCVWVVVQAHPLVKTDGTPDLPAAVYWYPQGNYTIAAALTGPALGPGTNLVELTTSNAGGLSQAIAPDDPRGLSTWLPLDPANTVSGVATTLVVLCGATGAAVGEAQANLQGCRMLGYPTSAWASGALWEPLGLRGS